MPSHKNILASLFLIVLLCSDVAFSVEGNNVVGLLVAKKETYKNEISKEIPNTIALLQNLGAKVVEIDYNYLMKENEANSSLDEVVEKFIRKNEITKVFIPGNYYNYDLPPYAPNQNRHLVTKSLVNLTKDKKIYLMGICGGLQGLLSSEGIKIANIERMVGKRKNHINHNQEYPVREPKTLKLEKVRIDPSSKLAKIVANNNLESDKHGWITIYLPHIHSEAMDNVDKNNIDKLYSLGYKISGFSDDGIIEIIEDYNGNIHFQSHPEILSIYANEIPYTKEVQKHSVNAIKAVIENFIIKK